MRTQTSQLISVSPRRVMRLLLAMSCSMLFAALTQAQSYSYDFLVPGPSGPAWVDTGIYLRPNTLVQFSATGEVDVSAGYGSHGPAGVPRTPELCAQLPGYPVGEMEDGGDRCYGLAAQLTQDRTPVLPFRVLGKWTYGEMNRYLAAPQGGHLWLIVNDDYPRDNTGAFKVHVEITTFPLPEILCHPCPFDKIDRKSLLGQPIPDPKTMQALLAFDDEITAIKRFGGTMQVSVSQGSVVTKYGNLPNLEVVFANGAARSEASLSKQGVIQGLVFQNEKMSMITGASRLKRDSKQIIPD